MESAANKPQFRVIEVAMTYRPEGNFSATGQPRDKFGSGAAEIEHHLNEMWKQDYDLDRFHTYDINQGNGWVPKVMAVLTFQRTKVQWNGTAED